MTATEHDTGQPITPPVVDPVDVSPAEEPPAGPPPVDPLTQLEIRTWLDVESMLLDDTRRLWEWHALLNQDMTYTVPVRVTRERWSNLPDFPEGAVHQADNWFTLRMRIQRLFGEHAWAEDPPSLLRRVVSGVVVTPGEDEAHYAVRSAFILHRSRQRFSPELWAGQRFDVLRREDDGSLKLAKRVVHLDHVSLPGASLSFFF